MNYSKISSIEAIAFIVVVMLNHIVLDLPNHFLNTCGNSAPLNIIFISILIFIFLYFVIKLFKNFANKDILDVSEFLGGKVLKTIIGILFISYFILLCGSQLRNFGEMLKIVYFPKLPICLLVLSFLVVGVFANKFSTNTIIKGNLIVVPLVMINLLIAYFCISSRFVPEKIFPILGSGINETFFSGMTNIFAFTGFSYIYFLQPMLKKTDNFKTISFIGIGISSIYLFLSITSLLFAFSDIISINEISPIYLLVRAADFGRFIKRPDAIFFLGWMLSLMSYVSITILLVTTIFKKIGNLKATFPMSYSVAFLLFIVALIPKGMLEIRFIENEIYKYATIILLFFISFFILIFANIKYRKKHVSIRESDLANE